jgi:hypothetical protein
MKAIFVDGKAFAAYLISGAAAGVEGGCLVEVERPINFGHDLARALIIGANHYSIGMLEVLDGHSFAQEFRVRDDCNVSIGSSVMNYASDLVAGAHGDRRFGDDHGEAVNRRRNLSGGCIHAEEYTFNR